MGLLGKSFHDIKKDFSNGQGFRTSLFSTSISNSDFQSLQKFNSAINATNDGLTKSQRISKAWSENMTGCSIAAKRAGNDIITGKKNIKDFSNEMQNSTRSTIGLTVAQTALNIAISMGLMAAISLAIKGFDKMINHAKRASEAADEAFEETSSKVEEQQEELKTLDELISKYRELKKDGTLDIEGRKEVKELQNDIADLVGTQARNLDLVNGKLDDEIEKLDEISAKEAKKTYETATANYNNSQRANQNAAGDDSYMFFDGYAYTGSREKDAEKILKEYGFGNNVRSGGFFSNTLFITDSYDNDMNALEGAQEKADYLQSMIDVLEQNGQRATELYSGLISQRDKYLGYIDSQQGAANSLVNSWITYSQYSNEELSNITVNSVESFEAYRQKMIEAAKNDESVGKLLSDGTLSEKDLETAVNDFMATSTRFSNWYKQWIGDVQGAGENILALKAKLSEYKQALADEYQKATDWGLDSYLEDIKNGTIQSTFGNVDMDKRTIITWSEELKKTYQDALASWEYDPEVGSIDTVFGSSDRFGEDLNGTGWEVAFTPILPDGTFLSKDTVYEYIDNILAEAYGNDNQVTEEELKSIDAQGRQIGQTFVKGIFAGVDDSQNYDNNGNWAETVGRLMHFSGDFGAVEIAQKGIADTSKAIEEATKNANKMTVSLSELEKTSDNIKTLASAFKELSDDGYITTKTLGEIKTATGLADDEWEEYETRLLSAKKGSSDFNQVMSDLTYKILDATFKKEGLVDATEDEIAAVLRENGVSNASAVAHDYLARTISSEEKAKAENSIRTRLLSGDIAGLIKNLSSEATACGLTETAFKNLAIQMVLTNETNMSFDDQIANLKALGVAAEITAAKIAGVNGYRNTKYSEKRNARGNMDSRGGLITSVGQETISGSTYIVYYGENGQIVDKEKIGADYDNLTTPKIPTYTSDGKSGSDKNKPDYEDPTDAIINRINLRADELAQQEKEIQNLIEIAELENDYKKQISLTNDLIAARKKRVDELNTANAEIHNEAEYLRSSNPWDEASWFDSQGNATEAYYNTLNSASTKEEQEAIKDLFEKLSKYKEAYAENAEEISDLNKEILQGERDIAEIRFDFSQNWIEERNRLGDWELFGDSEVDAWERVVKWLRKDYPNDLDKIKEAEEKLFDARKKKITDTLSHQASQLSSLKSLTQSHYDVMNSIADAQNEINKQLKASQAMYEYLDEDTRKLLFNQEDYNELSEELLGIQRQAEKLQRRYNKDIRNATANELDEITSQYEMQYELLMKQYETSKAELEVAKKRQQLNNVLNERNTRMFINGQWQWVANTEDVINAQNELADAKYAQTQAKNDVSQTKELNKIQVAEDKLNTAINNVESGIVDFTEEVGNLTGGLAFIQSYDIPALRSICNDASAAIKKFAEELAEATPQGTLKFPGGNVQYSHADGTRSTKAGLTLVGEGKDPFEVIATKYGLLSVAQPTLGNFGNGSIVFNQDQLDGMRNVWDMANAYSKRTLDTVHQGRAFQNVDNSNCNNIYINGMQVANDADGKALNDALRRYVATHR